MKAGAPLCVELQVLCRLYAEPKTEQTTLDPQTVYLRVAAKPPNHIGFLARTANVQPPELRPTLPKKLIQRARQFRLHPLDRVRVDVRRHGGPTVADPLRHGLQVPASGQQHGYVAVAKRVKPDLR